MEFQNNIIKISIITHDLIVENDYCDRFDKKKPVFFQQVSDQGGGIPRSLSERLFHYMYSTAPQPSKSDAHTVPLAGKYLTMTYT